MRLLSPQLLSAAPPTTISRPRAWDQDRASVAPGRPPPLPPYRAAPAACPRRLRERKGSSRRRQRAARPRHWLNPGPPAPRLAGRAAHRPRKAAPSLPRPPCGSCRRSAAGARKLGGGGPGEAPLCFPLAPPRGPSRTRRRSPARPGWRDERRWRPETAGERAGRKNGRRCGETKWRRRKLRLVDRPEGRGRGGSLSRG